MTMWSSGATRAIWALTLIAGCATPARHPTEALLRVATYNIQAGAGDLRRVADEIKAMDADLVALQEVDVHWHERSGFVDQATELGRMLAVQVRFAPIYSLSGGAGQPAREFGVALLSKHPIERWSNDSLTRLSTQDANPTPTRMPGLLRAVVNIRGARITVLTTHLDYRSDPAIRRAQVDEIVRVLERTAGPTILAGDLNAAPGAPELQPLFKRLMDSWRSSKGPGYTYPASAPTKRIDYVLYTSPLLQLDTRVPGSATADHRPVIASFRWLPPDRGR
jgi:endonuclease/exonuclease/phosphatase family metal-dependent hydrolase